MKVLCDMCLDGPEHILNLLNINVAGNVLASTQLLIESICKK